MKESSPEKQSIVAEEEARRIFGDHFFGKDEVQMVFGQNIAQTVERIPFSKKELIEARERGASLIYRIETTPDGLPVTMENLLPYTEDLLDADEEIAAAQEYDMEFYTREQITTGWVITRRVELPHTDHLSYEAVDALFNKNEEALEYTLVQIIAAWDEAGIPSDARPSLPTIDEFRTVMERLGERTMVPKAIDILYDALLKKRVLGQDLLEGISVATSSRNQELPEIDEPERPIDIGTIQDGKIKFHWRRSMQWGRPGSLGNSTVSGLPVGYIQKQAG